MDNDTTAENSSETYANDTDAINEVKKYENWNLCSLVTLSNSDSAIGIMPLSITYM